MTQPAPDATLDELLNPAPVRDGAATHWFPDLWQQGRGAFGGLVTGVLVRALEAQTPGRPLRSLTAELCGPTLPGEATLQSRVLRAGNAVTTTAVELVQGGEVQAHAVGVLGRERMKDRDLVALPRPAATPWRDVEVVPVEPPMAPVFAQHFEFRLVGALPFSGATEPVAEAWVRAKRPGVVRDAAFLAVMADTLWPAIFVMEREPRPMATIAFTFQPFPNFEGLDPAAPLLVRTRAVALDAGYCVELREVWGEDGRLLALNQQTMVLIK